MSSNFLSLSHNKNTPQNSVKLLRAYILLLTMKSCFKNNTLTIHNIKFWCSISPRGKKALTLEDTQDRLGTNQLRTILTRLWAFSRT